VVDCVHESLTVPNDHGMQEGTAVTHNIIAMSTSSPTQRKHFWGRKAEISTATKTILLQSLKSTYCPLCLHPGLVETPSCGRLIKWMMSS